VIKHFLAYGNSDQVSFRSDLVRECFDVMTVPGTIAAYYQDATAAFVLSSEIPYLIDPRTPLFQGRIESPKPSHVSLAEWHGEHVLRLVTAAVDGHDSYLSPSDFDDPGVLRDMVDRIVHEQTAYADRAPGVENKIDRYRRLLAEARGSSHVESAFRPAAPIGVVAPYFAVTSTLDPWWSVNRRVWDYCVESHANDLAVMPVVTVGDVSVLDQALAEVPADLGLDVLFWVTGFDERRAVGQDLDALWSTVRSASNRGVRLANMYGGYFSILLARAGLAAFGNGLTYSESRAWPALAATGAAPARYYVPALHLFLTPALAQALLDLAPTLGCECRVCRDESGRSRSVVALTYHELKEHFAAARQWERVFVDTSSVAEMELQLVDAARIVEGVRDRLPPRSNVSTLHLDTWARVLGRCA